MVGILYSQLELFLLLSSQHLWFSVNAQEREVVGIEVEDIYGLGSVVLKQINSQRHRISVTPSVRLDSMGVNCMCGLSDIWVYYIIEM